MFCSVALCSGYAVNHTVNEKLYSSTFVADVIMGLALVIIGLVALRGTLLGTVMIGVGCVEVVTAPLVEIMHLHFKIDNKVLER